MGRRLAVLGNVVADVLLHPVEKLPRPGLAARVGSTRILPGGCAFHTAATARRLGLAVELFGALGDDAAGGLVRAALAARELDGPGIQSAKTRTTVTVVLARADGERSFLVTDGASAQFRVDAGVRARLRRADHVHLSGWSLLPALMGRGMAAVLADLRRRGITTSLDTAWRDGVDWRRDLDPLLPHLTAVMPSIAEARAASGQRSPAQCARWFRARGVAHVLITQGPRGVLLADDEGELARPACPVRVVDTTGAGDSFAAGWIAAFLGGRSRAERLAFACASGALACTGLGGEAGPRDARAVERLARSSERSERAVPRAERRARPHSAEPGRRRESARGPMRATSRASGGTAARRSAPRAGRGRPGRRS